MYRDLKTQNFLEVRYFSIDIQKTLHVFRKTVLFIAHFDEYFDNSVEIALISRYFVLIEIWIICDFIFVIMIICTICRNFSIRISFANLCSTTQNWLSWKIWSTIFNVQVNHENTVKCSRKKIKVCQRIKMLWVNKKKLLWAREIDLLTNDRMWMIRRWLQ
jgi:hypothetical protein